MIITGGSIACTLPTALGFFSASVFFRSATALRPPMTTMGKLHTCITAYSRYAEDILSVRNSSRLSVCCRRRWLLDRTLSIAPARKPERLLSSSSSFTDAGEEPIVTVGGEAEAEETIKKSRFIGRCGPATTFEEAKELLSRVLAAHPKARHNCWAWRGVGDDHRFSDDGEPGGTAGQPILGGIQSEGVSEVMVVVTRYSGGIKLGTGGLCRAYSGAARLCLQAAEREMRTRTVQLSVTAPVSSLGGVYHAVSECQRLSEDFTEDGAVVLTVAVELAQVDEVRRRIQDATKGAAEIVAGDERP